MNKKKRTIRTGSDFSGVGAFDYAIERVCKKKGFIHERIFACDLDKYARKTYVHNHGEPSYYPEDVYKREIPEESLDIYMTSPPCQAFSNQGKRRGKEDKRGILFFNSLEFIKKNSPRFFIFENVKGLTYHDGGKTFQEWITLLGGKSIDGLPTIFPDQDSVPYHIYSKVINSKDHGIPQSRERIFIIGIRDDQDNVFTFPPEEYLEKNLQDIQEGIRSSKYLNDKTVQDLVIESIDKKRFKIKSKNLKGYEIASVGDCINYAHPSSKTRGGRIGRGYSQTILTSNTQGIIMKSGRIKILTPRECFRLMDFPDSFDFSVVSDTQAYKQAGNSIVVRVLEKIINKFETL